MTQYRMSLVVSLYKQNKKDPKYTLIISLLHLVRHHLQQTTKKRYFHYFCRLLQLAYFR
jgi:hypothetical protein